MHGRKIPQNPRKGGKSHHHHQLIINLETRFSFNKFIHKVNKTFHNKILNLGKFL